MSGRPGGAFMSGSVEVFGHLVGFAAAGAGDNTVVFLPGSAGSDVSWSKDHLARHQRVVELNPPGWGGSEPLNHTIDQRDLAIVLAAAIDAMGLSRFHLNGASMGGVTALWLAVQFPERVRSVSLEGSMAFVEEADLLNPEQVRVLADMVARNDPHGTGYPMARRHPRKPWADEDFFREQMRKRVPMMRKLTHHHGDALRERVRVAAMPILVMLGDQDELIRTSHLERWRRIAPQAQTAIITGGAHDIQNTEPEQFCERLEGLHALARFDQ